MFYVYKLILKINLNLNVIILIFKILNLYFIVNNLMYNKQFLFISIYCLLSYLHKMNQYLYIILIFLY